MKTNVNGKAYKFNLCYRRDTLTGHAGLVLLRDFVEKLGVPQLLDEQIQVKARQRGYPESENILSLCWNSLLGGDCLLDLNRLRGDAGLPDLLGVKSFLAPTTAGEFLRAFTIGSLSDLRRVNRVLSERVRSRLRHRRLTIDLDASLYAQSSTRKQGSRMNYKGQVGYYPVFAFRAEDKELLAVHLLSGNKHATPHAIQVLRLALAQAPPDVPRYLRADSEFYSWEVIDFCTASGFTWAITADQTKALRQALAQVPETSWKHYAKGLQVAEFRFAPRGRKEHRYVAKRRRVRDRESGQWQWRYHVIITSDERRTPRKVMQWALQRCGMENLIKEHKRDFGFVRLPTRIFQANHVWLLISQLAWNLWTWFNHSCLPAECHRLTLGTLRQRILNVAGQIVHRGRQYFLILLQESRYRDWWDVALQQLQQLSPISP